MHKSVADIEQWMVERIAQITHQKTAEIDVTTPFDHLGLDSAAVMAVGGDLEDWLGRPVHPTLPYDYPTIRSLATHLVEAEAQEG